jgi:hypothetical protein
MFFRWNFAFQRAVSGKQMTEERALKDKFCLALRAIVGAAVLVLFLKVCFEVDHAIVNNKICVGFDQFSTEVALKSVGIHAAAAVGHLFGQGLCRQLVGFSQHSLVLQRIQIFGSKRFLTDSVSTDQVMNKARLVGHLRFEDSTL